jgi:hypothetical protein
MIYDIGIHLDSSETGKYIYHYFDVKQDKSVQREEYFMILSLTDYELDQYILETRKKFKKITQGHTKIKHSRMLREVFETIDINHNHYLTYNEIQNFMSKLEIFITEEEGQRMASIMDVDKDGKVNEKDFITFLQIENDAPMRKAHRLREGSSLMRRWMLRGNGLTSKR